MKTSDISAENETIFLEILPELARKYEKSNFENSLNIYIKDLNFGVDNQRTSDSNISIENSGIQCFAKFENCVAIRQKRINQEEEMMFGVFGQDSAPFLENSCEISALNAQLVLPRPSDQYISQFELRDFEISKIDNPAIFSAIQSIFSCAIDNLKLRQRHKNEIFLHVLMEKEQKTSRSCIFEAVFEMMKFIGKIDKINKIRLICLPFVHFGNVRISLKIDKSGIANVKIFNLFGSLFGVFEGISANGKINNREGKIDNEKSIIFISEDFLNKKFIGIKKDSEEESDNFGKPENSKEFQKIKKSIIEILQSDMKINTSTLNFDFPLPYLGIDSLRIVELEFHVAKKWAELGLKSPFLKAHRTLAEVVGFLEKSIIERKSICEGEKSIIEEKPRNFEIPLSSQQKRIRFVEEIESIDKSIDKNLISQFAEPIFLQFPQKIDIENVQNLLNFLTMHHSILRTIYRLNYQFLLSATENFISIGSEDSEDVTSPSESLKCILISDNTLKLVFHHISIDGRSLSIFYKDFCKLMGKSMIIDFPRELQYHDYCNAITQSMENSKIEFWRQYLSAEDFSPLPLDFSQKIDNLTASTIFTTFPKGIQKTFYRICLQNGFSQFELFFGLLELSINRIFGLSEQNFAIGFAVDEREFEYFETMGCFTNVLPYVSKTRKIDIRKKSIIDFLSDCSETLRNLRQNSIPYEKIKKSTKIDNFQIFAVSDIVELSTDKKKKSVRFENDDPAEIQILQKMDSDEKRIAKYEMTWYLRQNLKEDSLQFEVEYASNLFKKSTINLLITEVFRLINIFSKSFSNYSQKSIIQKCDFPSSTVTQILPESAKKSIISQSEKINRYLDFSGKISRISRFLEKIHLKSNGNFRAEQAILVKLPRSPDLLEVLIATWQCGFYPVTMHMDSTDSVINRVRNELGGDKVIVITKSEQLGSHNRYRFFNRLTPFEMAYATCTSGSTGRPKLVGTALIGHSNLAYQYTKTYQLTCSDTILQSVDPSFDIFFADIFKCLLNSARLLMARDAIPTDSEILKASVAYLMPAFLARIQDFRDLRNLKVLQFGGESITPTVIEKVLSENKQLNIWQEYGLTEQTVYSSRKRIRGSIDIRKIGKPYDNIGMKIENFANRGQLFLLGTGIMRGYFGDLPPISEEFPTGDEVYLDENGEMIFVGRKDSQVKIRGFRVDLFEIECTALSSNLISSCTCIISSNNQLVLFFKPLINNQIINNQLKAHLENELIAYKVPNRLIEIQNFPLTRTGKIDKSKFREIAENQGDFLKIDFPKNQSIIDNQSIIPKNSNLRSLLKHHLEHFSDSRIPSDDVDLFTCGIDSISVMLTCQKLREQGYEVPVKTFFQQKTLRRILETFTESPGFRRPSEVTSEKRSPAHFIPLNHVQERILFLSRMTSSDFFRLEFRIPIDKSNDLGLATNTVILGNPLLRSIISRSSGDYQFLVLSATECYYQLGQKHQKAGDDQFETRIWLSDNQLFLSVHHIICDGRSLQILKSQFNRFFEENHGKINFERNFEQKIDNPQVKIDNFESIFPNFKFGSKSAKISFPTPILQSLPTHRIFHAFCQSISEKFKLRPFHVACTFINRSAHNWNTVSMFANTLPVEFNEKINNFEEFSNRLSEINNHSNVPLIDIVPPGIGTFADFAINFHKSIDNSDGFCQFPVLLTYSEIDNQSILEFDQKSISVEEINDLKRRILKFLGLPDKLDNPLINLDEIVIRHFRKFLITDNFSESIDFFASGGHSLSAMRLIDNLSEELKIDIPIRLIFDNPTPKGLIKVIRDLEKIDDQEKSITEKPVTCYQYPLSPQQLQMFYLSELTSLSLEYQLPFIQPFKKSINPESIHSALLSTIQEQSIFRTVFRMDSLSVPYQEVLSITECFIPCHVEFVLSEEELHRKIKELCEQKIDFLDGNPLIRAAFLTSDNPEKINNVAFLHLHHLISDARSTQLMNLSMQEFIRGRSQKRMRYQYVDYCRESIDNQSKIDNHYLSTLVGGAIPTLSAVISPSKSSITVPETVFQGIPVTPFSHFLTVITQILITTLSVPSLNITFPVINRSDKTSGICGYFLNNLIINTSNLSDLATVIQENLPYSQVIREARKSIDTDKKSISDIYINCRYDLEFDESDDEILLDLVPMKLHFPLEIDMDKVGGAYKITIRSNQFDNEKIKKILTKLENRLKEPKGAKPKDQYIPIHGPRKDFPSRLSLPNLYHQFFKSINNQLCPDLPYPRAFSQLISQSALITRQFLITRGTLIRSDDVIAIIGRKSIDITMKCLAVQYAGAAYLPIDKDYPEKRKKEILKDSVFIWSEGDEKRAPLKTRHFASSTPESLAYIITTSGTTGKPKSVAISCLSVANLALSSTVTMCISSRSRIFQFTNFVFDNSVLEVIMAISNQAMLIYADNGDKNNQFDPVEFQKSIDTPGISHCLLFPSLVQSISIDKINKLAYWIVGGERLPQGLLEDVLSIGCHVIQNYGPTETTAFAIAKRMKTGHLGAQIGQPAVNSKLLIFENGELLISGVGRMRGYLNRLESFRSIDNDEWYCSGDICRRMENGDVEFLGRNDSQIKLRGFRVELSEIERTLESHCHVTNCKALFSPESQQIHVFCKMDSVDSGDSEDLRNHCKKYLEGHKVPSTFTKIKEFPLTRNSKIDMEKLAEMVKYPKNQSISVEKSEKSTTAKPELSKIWTEILNCRPTDSDDFFAVGGHSLLLIRLRHQILSRIRVSLTVPEILENLKFGDLVELIDKKKHEEVENLKKLRKINTFVFFPALYGGCAAYLKLCENIRKIGNCEIIMLEEEDGNTVEEVAEKYKKQISRKVANPLIPLSFIGASAAGTFAFATCHLSIDNPINLFLLDAGTFWNLIDNLDYDKHVQEITENLKSYGVDGQELAEKSWKTLQIMKNFKGRRIDRSIKMHVLSVDGTDLGWSRLCENVRIHKISGDHYSMLQDPVHVEKIARILTDNN